LSANVAVNFSLWTDRQFHNGSYHACAFIIAFFFHGLGYVAFSTSELIMSLICVVQPMDDHWADSPSVGGAEAIIPRVTAARLALGLIKSPIQ
jgi:hypothetical protein